MKNKENEYYVELKFKDVYGKVTLRVQKDLSQISLTTVNGDCYADTNKETLTAIRDTINKALENK